MGISVTLLGTGSPLPDPQRAGPATLVRAGGRHLLVDAGRGVAMRLAGAGVLPPMVDAVLLTHLHSDHICDLNDVVTSRWVMSPGPAALPVIGPRRTAEVVEGMQAMLGPDVEFRLAHHADLTDPPLLEVREVVAGDEIDLAGIRTRVGATDHRPVEPSVGFRFEHDGRSVVLGGDGRPCDSLDALCAGADVYVQTVIRDDLVRAIPAPRLQDILDYHSSVADAARTATRAGVRTLVLTHYVPGLAAGQEPEWRAVAEAHFDGQVVLGDDLTTVEA